MFLDEAKINIKAGDGGNGMVSFFNLKAKRRKIASGGSGGRGGDLIIRANSSQSTLYNFKKKVHFKAQNGGSGLANNRNGKDGDNLIIEVPVGTVVKESDGKVVADLNQEGKEVLMAQGGIGGRGNASFTSQARRFPGFAEYGEKVQDRWIKLELRLLADVGLVGFPNAGKSTIISRITAAKPKIADYPFTTLVPNLGVVSAGDSSFVIADIPGLIEGAHKGTGLGDKFLRHIMRTSVIVFVLDLARVIYQQSSLEQDLLTLKEELELYSPMLAKKGHIVVVNKIDLVADFSTGDDITKELRKHTQQPILFISAVTGQGLDQLVRILDKTVQEQRKAPVMEEEKKQEYKVYNIYNTGAASDRIEIEKIGTEYLVKNSELERMVQMTDLENEEGLNYLRHRLQKKHIGDKLKQLGVETGATVIIGKLVFELKD
ncbi:MAG: GTPase ObgE [Actinomycetota bacterium]|nr:GTPase ObgE [Actinomycetota bacterium]